MKRSPLRRRARAPRVDHLLNGVCPRRLADRPTLHHLIEEVYDRKRTPRKHGARG